MTSSSVLDIESLRARRFGTFTWEYGAREVVLYALGLGCRVDNDLRFVYECHEDFAVLPTFPVIAAHPAILAIPLSDYIPNCDVSRGLHGEQYIELTGGALPPNAKVVTRPYLVDIQDKGKGAVVVVRTVTTDTATGRDIAVQEFTSFIMGAGGFGSPWPSPPRPPAAVGANNPPTRDPDFIAQEKTSPDQAALYRLSGDLNPLHIDPEAASLLGFKTPILHGLCSLGVSVKLVMMAFGGGKPDSVKSVKVRFSKHVFPGETLQVRMWRMNHQGDDSPSNTVIFETRVLERPGTVAISNAAVEFHSVVAPFGQMSGVGDGGSKASRL